MSSLASNPTLPEQQCRDAECLLRTQLAEGLNERECEVLATRMQHQQIASGELLFREGEPGNTLYIVLSGQVAVTRDSGHGLTHTLAILKTGDMAGEMSFLDGDIHSASLRAMGPVEVLTLNRDTFEAMLESHPRLVYAVMRAIVHHVHDLMRRANAQQTQLNQYINFFGNRQ